MGVSFCGKGKAKKYGIHIGSCGTLQDMRVLWLKATIMYISAHINKAVIQVDHIRYTELLDYLNSCLTARRKVYGYKFEYDEADDEFINYEISSEIEKRLEKVGFICLLGLHHFINHSDCDGSYNLIQIKRMLLCLRCIKPYLLKIIENRYISSKTSEIEKLFEDVISKKGTIALY